MKIAQAINNEIVLNEVDEINLKGMKGAIIKVNGSCLSDSDIKKTLRELEQNGNVLGYDVVGRIEEIDSETDFRINERILVSKYMPCMECEKCKSKEYSRCSNFQETKLFPGGFSEKIFVSEEQLKHASRRLPSRVSDIEVSIYTVLGTCINAIDKTFGEESGSALVLGLDTQGLLIAQLLNERGCKLYGGDLSDSRITNANNRKIETYSISNIEMFNSIIKHKTLENGVDVVYISSNNDNALNIALEVVKKGGKIVLLSELTEDSNCNINAIYQKDLTIFANCSPARSSLNKSFQHLIAKKIQVLDLINIYAFDDINQAISDLSGGNAYRAFIDIGQNIKKIKQTDTSSSNESFQKKEKEEKSKPQVITLGQHIISYNIDNVENKHKALETDDEFEKQCQETYEIKNSKFCLPMKDSDLIQSCIYNSKNYWDIGLFNKIDNILKDKATILDIGANIGNHTLYWANERNAKKVFAFEPYTYSYKVLEKNIEINHLEKKVTAYNFGISDKESKGSVVTFCPTNIGGLKFENDSKGDFEFKPLDSLKIRQKIDLIKIDVEGAELEVLNGGIKTIKKNLPIIVVETFSNKDKIEELLYPLGYEFYDANLNMCDYIYYCKDKSVEK